MEHENPALRPEALPRIAPDEEWKLMLEITRMASRLMETNPSLSPRDAVRDVAQVFGHAVEVFRREPETAAAEQQTTC